MKNTYVPLDIVFVAANGTVLNVAHATPQPNADASDLRLYRSDGEAKYVIELRRGFANRTGIGPGTTVNFGTPRPPHVGMEPNESTGSCPTAVSTTNANA
jgi:uncharacterized membrane protein (UPF0127 family)